MGRAAGLHLDQARRQTREELQEFGPPQLLAQYHRTRPIDPVKLKHALRDIQPDRANLRDGRLLSMRFPTTSSRHIDAVAGAVHPITVTTGRTRLRPIFVDFSQNSAHVP